MSKNSVPAWPFEKVEENLASTPRGRRCVLLSTGSLNPVHRGHVAMFDKAKAGLEADFGFEVVGGFLSPSHDLYVKTKPRFLPAELRLAMCAAATRDHPFLAVGAWECSVDGYWPDFPEVKAELGRALKLRFAEAAPEVMYLCGEDHFRYAEGVVSPLCVIPRNGCAVETDESRDIYAIENSRDDPYDDMSSTRVRKALLDNGMETLSSHLHPDVLALLRAYQDCRGHA